MKGDITKIYGVDRVGSYDPSALMRTDSAVGLNVTAGASEITSDFDSCYPWSDIEEVTDEFGNVFIKIPKFYSKITKIPNEMTTHQISGTKYDGFDTLFKIGGREIDYVLIGKYEGSGSESRVYSHKNKLPLTGVGVDSYRTACRANGEGYQQYDLVIDCIIKELWLVEMKTQDVQSIMRGRTAAYEEGKQITGTTDGVGTPTSSGSATSNTDGKHACKYRGIENPWGDLDKWCDGIKFDSSSIYICTDPDAYSSSDSQYPYVAYPQLWKSSGYVIGWNPVAQDSILSFISSVTSQSSAEKKGYCDWAANGGSALACGGTHTSGNHAGLWCYSRDIKDNALYWTGGRLCYKPTLPKVFNPRRNKIVCSIGRLSDISSTQQVCYGLAQLKLPNSKQEAFYLQPESCVDPQTGDLKDTENTELEYLNYPHPFDPNTGEELTSYTHINDSINTKASRKIGECCLQSGVVTNQLANKSWKAHFTPRGQCVWTDGDTLYYSNVENGQYWFDKSANIWKRKTWIGATPSDGKNIWTDGEHVYYSSGKSQYQLDKVKSIWSEKEWTGLTSFDGYRVWTDGNNIYYSDGNKQYQLDKSTSTWNTKTWNGKWCELGERVWRDRDDIYSYYSQYQNFHNIVYYTKLDKTTSTWGEGQHWSVEAGYEYDYVDGLSIWTYDGNVYFSNLDRQLVLNKTTKQWEHKTWHWLTDLPPKSQNYTSHEYEYYVAGPDIWFYDNNVYSSFNGENYKLNIETSTWERQIWLSEQPSIKRTEIWDDGTNIFWSKNAVCYQLNGDVWEIASPRLDCTASGVWHDSGHTYRDSGAKLDREKKEWIPISWKGLTSFSGQDIWSDGVDLYCSLLVSAGSYKHYKLDRTTSTWNEQKWEGRTLFRGRDIWTDGINIYYSQGTVHRQLNRSTSIPTWEYRQWAGVDSFRRTDVWYYHNNVYCSIGNKHYQLQIEQNKWVLKNWEGDNISFSGENVWTKGDKFYVSNDAQQLQLVINAPNISQYNVWTDLKRIQIDTPAGPRVVQTKEAAKWDDTKFWVEGWDKNADTHMAQVKRHPQLTNKILNIDCYMQNIDDLYTALETCTLSYENDVDNNSGTWYLKKPDGSTCVTLKVKQTPKQEG